MAVPDAVVVGAGPNGLAAAVVMARAGRSVLVLEANDAIGGAARTEALTLPGFLHDPFSAVHPLAAGSPFLAGLPLHEHGLEWAHPDVPLAHPLDDGPPALLERSVAATSDTLGADSAAWRRLVEPFVERWGALAPEVLGPMLHLPRHPLLLARFGLAALRSTEGLAAGRFREARAKALLAGISAHSALPLNRAATASFGLVLAVAAHAVGWPVARGGSGRITAALASYLRSLGGEVVTGVRIRSLGEVPPARAVFLDLTARQVLEVCGERLPAAYRRTLAGFRYGAGAFKVDWALDAPVPWKAEACARAGTVHLGGTLEELSRSERAPWRGEVPERPYVLFVQPSLFDATRAPAGKHVAWAYCHVPNGCTVDMTERMEAQVERFAPGFRERVLARHSMGPTELERRDANLVGGDIAGGAPTLGQMAFRPTARLNPYATPLKGVYLCSSSTPPGGGVHGMCGYHAARTALRDGF